MKDTVTYPLSAITGDEEESRIDQLERELAEARAEIVRLKGKAELWEKGFDRACDHFTAPPRKEWVGLTQTQVKLLREGVHEESIKTGDSINWVFYTHINEALKEKNSG